MRATPGFVLCASTTFTQTVPRDGACGPCASQGRHDAEKWTVSHFSRVLSVADGGFPGPPYIGRLVLRPSHLPGFDDKRVRDISSGDVQAGRLW